MRIFLICLIFFTQFALADVQYDGKISPVVAAKLMPVYVWENIKWTPLYMVPIVNIFAGAAAGGSGPSAEYRVFKYENNLFIKNATEEKEQIKNLPLYKKLYKNDEYEEKNFFDDKKVTYQNYEYKIKIANLIYDKYELSKKDKICKDCKACIDWTLRGVNEVTYPAYEYLIKNNLLCKTGRLHYIHNFKDVENFLNGYYEEFLQLRREDKNFRLSESEFMSLKNQNLSLEEIKEFNKYENKYGRNVYYKLYPSAFAKMKKKNLSEEKIIEKIEKSIKKEERKDKIGEATFGLYVLASPIIIPVEMYRTSFNDYIEEVKFQTYKQHKKENVRQ